ncbi:hypothetical protein SUGI_0628310 [Cryptomeria japonica]|nr:hypothetical protein SUGI_0628310 [Cryptomeria japonica]
MEGPMHYQIHTERVFIAIFRDFKVKERILNTGVWFCWNMCMVLLEPYSTPVWIRLYNLSIEYWVENCLEKIGRSLGTLLEIDEDLTKMDSYLYAKIRVSGSKKDPENHSVNL